MSRKINKEEYPMVLDWSNYKKTTSKLPCKCQNCGKTIYPTIANLDVRNKRCLCKSCASSQKREINRKDYPMVINWDGYINTKSLVLCECQNCNKHIRKKINNIDNEKSCFCYECGIKIKRVNTCIERYDGVNQFQNEEVKKKIKKTLQKKYGVENVAHIPEIKKRRVKTCRERYGENYEKRNEKGYNTKRKNGTWVVSKDENLCYDLLLNYFNKNNVIRQYNEDPRYPFLCDFYIKSLDLFIECNFNWVHGKEPYDPNNEKHQEILKEWTRRSEKRKNDKKRNYYMGAIYTWSISDKNKIDTAKINNIKYLIFYNMKQFNKWYNEYK